MGENRRPYVINLETASHKAYCTISDIDRGFLGTKDYLGLAWFHAHEYRHYMRDITLAKRKRIHNALIKAELDLDGISPEHETIILNIIEVKQ